MTTILKEKTELPNVIFVKLHKEDLWKKTELKVEVTETPKQAALPENIIDNAPNVIQEIDLMNFDDEVINNNIVTPNIKINNEPSPSIIDILLCDPTFGSNNSKNSVTRTLKTYEHGNKVLVEKPSEKEGIKQSTAVEAKSPVELNKLMDNNGVQLRTDYPRATTDTTIKKDIQTETYTVKSTKLINSTTKPDSSVRPREKKVYTFMELILYKYSPLTKEVTTEFNVLLDSIPSVENESNRPSRRRNSDYNGRIFGESSVENESNRVPSRRRNSDYNGRIFGESNLYIAPAVRKNSELSPDISFINELIVAQNRWIALVLEKKLQKENCFRRKCANMASSHIQAKDTTEENYVTQDFQYHETTRPRKAVRFLEINEND
ncbi:21013_t:CDS:2 [Dentiscutata erythropus]|uniref:21013_t:CDS:1 n=1 Tax=Dentiscutata erythropus TaxID=1348616 RepID=A0A9N9IFM4_9GLOM|nr:21013_t:CDS:2 [Dentiscutata erythropus]